MATEKRPLHTDHAPKAIGPYAQGWQVGSLVFTSGQLGIDPATGRLAEGVKEQTAQSLENIRAILTEAGTSMGNIVKTTVFLQDLNDFAAVNEVYKSYFTAPYPARSCFEVGRLPSGGLVEIECVACI